MNQEKPIILFDGYCNLCNSAVDFILKRDKKKQFRFVALQSEKGRRYIDRYKISFQTDSVILIKKEGLFVESEAAIEIGRMLPAPWKWAGFLRFIPAVIRNGIYRWIAKNRYRWFGKRSTCRMIKN